MKGVNFLKDKGIKIASQTRVDKAKYCEAIFCFVLSHSQLQAEKGCASERVRIEQMVHPHEVCEASPLKASARIRC